MKSQALIADINEGQNFEGPVYIVSSKTAVGKTGKEYLSAIVADKSGEYDCKAWDNFGPFLSFLSRGNFAYIKAKIGSFQNKKQVTLLEASPISGDQVPWEHFRMEPPKDLERYWEELNRIVDTIEKPYWKKFILQLWKEKDIEKRFKIYPAAKSVHHSGPGGLLIHCLSILKIVDFLSSHYKKYDLNRDLLILGGVLHDIGKLFELSYDFRTEYTLEGQLIGHITIGCELLENICSKVEGIPLQEKLHLKHIILSHHGHLEFGSPKIPVTKEAFLFHLIDNLDSKMETISDHINNEMNDDGWTNFNRFIERTIYVPKHDKTLHQQPSYTQSEISSGKNLGEILKEASKKLS